MHSKMVGETFLLVCALLQVTAVCGQEPQLETVTGTIYCNNEARLYVNGEFVAADLVATVPHNAFNVEFQVPAGEPVTVAIEAIDFDTNDTGLELGRCIGGGALRATFSNGIATNSSWRCFTYLYGPVNWRQCYAHSPLVDSSHARCFFRNESFPVITGCWGRRKPIPEGWTNPEFDDCGWAQATEWEEDIVGFGILPPGCDNGSLTSTEVDSSGQPLICQNNVDWGNAQFIWGDDLDLDNRLLCRYTTPSSSQAVVAMVNLMVVALCLSLSISTIIFG